MDRKISRSYIAQYSKLSRSACGFPCRDARMVLGKGQEANQTPVVLTPRANPDLVGHEYAERELRRLLEAGRLPHAILLSGPRGIGKATLAFRFARFLLAKGDQSTETAGKGGLAIARESGVFHRVAAGGHADLLTVERSYDPRRRRLRGGIGGGDAPEITRFFRFAAAGDGWRIGVFVGAGEKKPNAAKS